MISLLLSLHVSLVPYLLGATGVVLVLLLAWRAVRTFRLSEYCPTCRYPFPDRIARRGLLRYLPLRAYWCPACRHRFYVVDLFSPESSQVHKSDSSSQS